MFQGIIDKQQLSILQKRLKAKLNLLKPQKHTITIGYQGASLQTTVFYSPDLNIWWDLGIANNKKRYWNAFGVGIPKVNSSNNITLEINNPIEGVNFLTAANWARDEYGNFYLFHSGKIGGGKKGIGQKKFIEKYVGELYEVVFEKRIRKSALVGKLKEADFVNQLAFFVNQVANFKNLKTTGEEIKNYSFSKEFDGKKIYSLPEQIVTNGNHGIIVNELFSVLKSQGKQVGSNGSHGRIDLFTFNLNNELLYLFEVKSNISLQSIYTAIGQLLVYSYPLKIKPALVFVCPNNLSKKMKDMLYSIGVNVLEFKWLKGKPVFIKINEIMNIVGR